VMRGLRVTTAILVGVSVSPSLCLGSESDCEAAYVHALDRDRFPDPIGALKFFEPLRTKCVADDPAYLSHLAALNNLAGRDAIGEMIVADGLATDPSNKNLLFSQVYVLLRHKDVLGATEIARRLMQQQPDWYGGYAAYQLALLNGGKAEESLDFGKKAIALSHDQVPLVYLNDAVAKFRTRDYVGCAEDVQKALAHDPSLASLPWGVDEAIFALDRLHRDDEAIALAKRRIAADANWRADPNLLKVAKMAGLSQ
jgi:tetratricopeptide (TPR) repeat protein